MSSNTVKNNILNLFKDYSNKSFIEKIIEDNYEKVKKEQSICLMFVKCIQILHFI